VTATKTTLKFIEVTILLYFTLRWCHVIKPVHVIKLLLLKFERFPNLPAWTVSLCLAVNSARTAVGCSITPARQS